MAGRTGRRAGALLAGALLAAVGCAPESEDTLACDVERGLMVVAQVQEDPEDPCGPWARSVAGGVVRIDDIVSGSASLWSLDTGAGVGVLVSAAHVLSPCWSIIWAQDDAGLPQDCPSRFYDPTEEEGKPVIRLAEGDTARPASEWSPVFPLFSPDFPVSEVFAGTLAPRDDFSVYVVDGQTIPAYADIQPPEPEPITGTAPQVHDPQGRLRGTPSWREAPGGAAVLVVGYPDRSDPYIPQARQMEASVGEVLDDDTARAVISELAAAGDEEGEIPYDPAAEMLLWGQALPGMSGSGVYDQEGTLVGVAVRATTTPNGRGLVRAVRISHIAERLADAAATLPADQRGEITPYLPPL